MIGCLECCYAKEPRFERHFPHRGVHGAPVVDAGIVETSALALQSLSSQKGMCSVVYALPFIRETHFGILQALVMCVLAYFGRMFSRTLTV